MARRGLRRDAARARAAGGGGCGGRRLIDREYWGAAIRRGDATFLVGAGISAVPPSSLPLASGLVESLLRPIIEPLSLPASLSESITTALVQLRPEVITDVLIEHLGVDAARPILTTLRGRPNEWHVFLADALRRGCCVITTNFDTLIEDACDAAGVRIREIVGTAVGEWPEAKAILFKIHGSIGAGLDSIALAVRQVGLGLSLPQTKLLRKLIADRPLIVLGYSGRDDFDLRPAMCDIQRSAPGLWIVHESDAPLREARTPAAAPALEVARVWGDTFTVIEGDTGIVAEILGVDRNVILRRADAEGSVDRARTAAPERDHCIVALMYALVEARAFPLASRLFEHVVQRRTPARIRIAHAVALEKEGSDMRAAADAAAKARRASAREPGAVRALVFDQSGVIARRRGLYKLALRFYDRALDLAIASPAPEWLTIQVRSHRAVALEYLGRRPEALREHRRVAKYEKETGDLRGYAKSLNNIGIVHMNQRQWRKAIDALDESCRLKRDLGDERGIAQSLHNLGKLHFLRGDYESAERTFLESLDIRLGRGLDEHGAAQSYVALAHVALERGETERAADYARKALAAHERFGDRRGALQARNVLAAISARPEAAYVAAAPRR